MMDDKLIEAIMALGSDEEAIAELLRQADRQESIADDTRGKDYLTSAGRVNVANPWGAISDMFVRGQSEKRAKKLRGEADVARRASDSKMRDWFNSALGIGPGGPPLAAPGGPPPTVSPPPGGVPITPVPPITPPAQGAPAPRPAAPPAPAPAAPAVPPKPRVPQGMEMGPSGMPTHKGWNDVPLLPGQDPEEAQAEELLALLRQQ